MGTATLPLPARALVVGGAIRRSAAAGPGPRPRRHPRPRRPVRLHDCVPLSALTGRDGALRGFALAVMLAMAAALLLHAVPGFANPRVLDGVTLSLDSAPYTKYLNFDKGVVGLLLLGLYAPRADRCGGRRRARCSPRSGASPSSRRGDGARRGWPATPAGIRSCRRGGRCGWRAWCSSPRCRKRRCSAT